MSREALKERKLKGTIRGRARTGYDWRRLDDSLKKLPVLIGLSTHLIFSNLSKEVLCVSVL